MFSGEVVPCDFRRRSGGVRGEPYIAAHDATTPRYRSFRARPAARIAAGRLPCADRLLSPLGLRQQPAARLLLLQLRPGHGAEYARGDELAPAGGQRAFPFAT